MSFDLKSSSRVVYVTPYSGYSAGDGFFEAADFCGHWTGLKQALAERGVVLKCVDLEELPGDGDLVWVQSPPKKRVLKRLLKHYRKRQRMLSLWEPPAVDLPSYDRSLHRCFSKVYTWDDNLVDNKKYYKHTLFHPLKKRFSEMDFDQKKLATLVCGNKHSDHPAELYSERRKIIDYFEKSEDLTFYGVGWPEGHYRNYGGPVDDKIEALKNFRFCFAYENMCKIDGYITEKIFDCFVAGCVPIYWGASNIEAYIPSDCYILRENFGSLEELHSFLKGMDEATHSNYLAHIDRFLDSSVARRFSRENFIDTYLEAVFSYL